jgi:hypothetical protein
MVTASTEDRAARPSSGIHIGLWIVQGLLSLTFAGGGVWKLATPIPELATKMPWMGQVSPSLLYATAVFDILGGLGVLMPSVTRIKPGLTVLAARGQEFFSRPRGSSRRMLAEVLQPARHISKNP